MTQVGDDWLFEMWHRLSGDQGAIASLNANARVGQAAAQELSVQTGQIPGVPRLFWLLPDLRLLCTVQVAQRGTSRPEFQRYIRDFIKHRGPWAVTRPDEDGEGLRILGWSADPTQEPQRLLASFRLGTSVDARKVDEIRRRREDIRAILYRGRVDVGRARSRLTGITGLLDRFARLGRGLETSSRPFRINLELPYTPGQQELEGLIEEASGADGGFAPDVGFRLDPERSIMWLSAKNTRLAEMLEVPYRNRAQVHLDDLLTRLRRRFRGRLQAAAQEE
ncbi:MAG: hypothetical protein ACREOQ_17815 [Gemmatimonadales bacterium]